LPTHDAGQRDAEHEREAECTRTHSDSSIQRHPTWQQYDDRRLPMCRQHYHTQMHHKQAMHTSGFTVFIFSLCQVFINKDNQCWARGLVWMGDQLTIS